MYEATLGGWRINAHGRTAESLSVRGASIAARAHHVEHSARHGDLAAVAVLRAAGEDAAARAPASTARWFAGALRLLPAATPAEDRVALLFGRAQALAATGQFADSHEALLESPALVPRGGDRDARSPDGGLRGGRASFSAIMSRPAPASPAH